MYKGEEFDYCYKEAIQCLLDFCDFVIVVAGGEDGTLEYVQSINHPLLKVIPLSKEEWDSQQGKEKLNYFTNVAIQEADRMGFQYNVNLQGDEIIHEKSYESIRRAIATNQEAFMCTRVNLWGSPYTELNVPPERMPCSGQVIRLAKINYRSAGDAESINAPCVFDFVNEIKIWHMGFVRKSDVMKRKVIHMQEEVFKVDHDVKLDGSDVFLSERWFSKEELKYINEPLPLIIQDWAKERR